ncbi:MAG: GlsB/YeaQ/YmgE family stress response membrane protein [Pikeienuella sp.]|uniref:GlsB/YeaQ/YmgE family stress response membrane protein n=1 Tax=Pikeienuella sp. TaxID=2831957 RepID=UPI00391CDAEE
MGWIGAIVIGGLAGWIAEKIMGANHSLLLNIVLGIVGSVVANFLLIQLTGATFGGFFGRLGVGIAGACLLIAAARLLRRA